MPQTKGEMRQSVDETDADELTERIRDMGRAARRRAKGNTERVRRR